MATRRGPKAPKPPAVATHVALLRGINLGGRNKLPMRDLAAIFTDAGCTDVRTYVQSGNVVFRVAPGTAGRLPATLSKAIADRFHLCVPVLMRTAAELRVAVSANPFLGSGVDASSLHVAFQADRPDPAKVRALDASRSPGDSFKVRGREIFLCLANGVGRSKLTNAYFDSKLGTTSTIRNWRTVRTLVDMTDQIP